MQPSPAIDISCDRLIEFEDDVSAFAQGMPEFIHGTAPNGSVQSPQTPTDSSPPCGPSDQGK